MHKPQKMIGSVGLFLSIFVVIVATPGFSQQESLNLIGEVKGTVEIKRDGRGKYQGAYGGELLNPSDKLRLQQGASVNVVCDNLSIWNPQSRGEFLVSQGCSSATRAVLRRPNSNRSETRNANDPTIPYLISPRNTAILTRQPTLTWNKVAGATSYQVQVSGPGVNWTTQVSQPQVVYSGSAALQGGKRYWVTITAHNGVSTKNKDNPGFTVLSDADMQRVKTQISQLQQKLLSDKSKVLALAHLYRSNELNAEAIAVLDKAVKQGNQTTAVYQLLGSIYQQVGLNLLAKERYLTGLNLAKAEQNWEAQAMIQESLGEVEETLDQLKNALQRYQEAQGSYRVLGDEGKVQKLQQKLDDLKGRSS
ncbi:MULTISPECIES: tetratricopeptide repeat protein [unclassified Microcoleus]|uniref:tetratricopeptide repeat protein n=1 Tax=unclassified Microcoleus TaxID=2642155 RepID=UPI002FD2D502